MKPEVLDTIKKEYIVPKESTKTIAINYFLFRVTRLTSHQNPIGILIGGAPGSGKTYATNQIMSAFKNDILPIDVDQLRTMHPLHEKIVTDSKISNHVAELTQDFASTAADIIMDEAINKRINIIKESAIHSAQSPMKTIQKMIDSGYKTCIFLQLTDKNTAINSTKERYNNAKDLNSPDRRVVSEQYMEEVYFDLKEKILNLCSMGEVKKIIINYRNIDEREESVQSVVYDSDDGEKNDLWDVLDKILNREELKPLGGKTLYDRLFSFKNEFQPEGLDL